MFNTIENVLTGAEIAELRAIAARANFIDGRISAPGAPVKNNVVIGRPRLVRPFGASSSPTRSTAARISGSSPFPRR